MRLSYNVLVGPLALIGLGACQELQQNLNNSSAAGTVAAGTQSNYDPLANYTDEQVLAMFEGTSCNAMGTQTQTSAVSTPISWVNGVVARLRFAPANAANRTDWNNLSKFDAAPTLALENDLYFRKVDIPTRSFSEGFPTLNGGHLKDESGARLVEYFRVDFQSVLELSSIDEADQYEFAVLADDGARLKIDGTEVVNFPNVTPTRMMCGTQPVDMKQGERLAMELSYFQGPKYHIALQLLYRKAGQGAEPLCGASGNDRWFDYSKSPAVPKSDYLALRSRGWSVVPARMYNIPEGANFGFNPCEHPRVKELFCTAATCEGLGI